MAIAISRSTADALVIGDSRPTPLGTVGGKLALGLPVRWGWSLSAEGLLTGTWYDFNNGNQNSGNITAISPGLRVGAFRRFELSRAIVGEVGAAFEYSEVRSWSHARIVYQPYDVTGPRNFRRGGLLRFSLEGPAERRLVPFLEITEAALWAQATEHSFSASYHWLTFGSTVNFGIKWHATGKAAPP